MRKKALKKMYPKRNKILKFLREKNQLVEIVSKKGTPIVLNLMKHLLLQTTYKNNEYNKELFRFTKHNLSVKKEMKEEGLKNDRPIIKGKV